MVKPLNKEWELFGARYRIAGAKGDKVDCHACHKQVSAAVNRLQSHMRMCPARATLLATMEENAKRNQQLHPHLDAFGAHATHAIDSVDRMGDASELTDAALDASGGASHAFLTNGSAASAPGPPVTVDVSTTQDEDPHATSAAPNLSTAPTAKRHKTSVVRAKEQTRWNPVVIDDLWLTGGAPQPSSSDSSSAYAKRRLELEEKRLLLEMKKDQREERRELVNLEILEAQARKERLATEKEVFETKVLLALSRKQLRDQGVSEDEIERILPVENSALSTTGAAENQC